MPRLKGSPDLLEDRRGRALALLDSGYALNELGRRIGCNASSVMRRRDPRRRSGEQGLRVRISAGGPLKVDRRQRRRLVTLLLQRAHGARLPNQSLGHRARCRIDSIEELLLRTSPSSSPEESHLEAQSTSLISTYTKGSFLRSRVVTIFLCLLCHR